MMGETNKGFCFRERALWYGTGKESDPCRIPLTDGALCGDASLYGSRCPYNQANKNKVDTADLVYITYPQCNQKGKDA